jgi:hypothetical protein
MIAGRFLVFGNYILDSLGGVMYIGCMEVAMKNKTTVTNTHTCRRCGEGVDCNGTQDQFCDSRRGMLCFDGYCDPCERTIQAEDRAYDAARRAASFPEDSELEGK